MKNIWKLLGLFTVVILMTSLSGCIGGQTSTPSPTTSTTLSPSPTALPSPSPNVSTPPSADPIRITSPANNTNLSYSPTVEGTSRASSVQKIWVIVYNYKVSRYYPQNGPIAQSNGTWSSIVYLGLSGTAPGSGIGEKFDIIAVLADQDAHNVFEQYQNSSRQANSYPGIASLPSGITKDQITVTRTS